MATPSAASRIDALRSADGSLDRDAVRSVLPYGEGFLFVDRITRLSADEVEAIYRIPHDAPFVRSHFVHAPLMPGVLTGEGMAQAGSLLIRYRLDLSPEVDILVTQVESAVFSAPAVPGDLLTYRVTLRNVAAYGARLVARAHVDALEVCAARLCVVIVDRPRLQRMMART